MGPFGPRAYGAHGNDHLVKSGPERRLIRCFARQRARVQRGDLPFGSDEVGLASLVRSRGGVGVVVMLCAPVEGTPKSSAVQQTHRVVPAAL